MKMSNSYSRPLVALPCDVKPIDTHKFHMVGEKYIDAVRDYALCTPLLVPATMSPMTPAEVLPWADGLLFTGALSNVHPGHYHGPEPRPKVLLDPQRDDLTLPLIKAAIEAGIPSLFICRGFQELNVAMGGTLHQHLQEVPGRFDHREPAGENHDVMYGPVHDVTLTSGGLLQKIMGADTKIQVNSLHGQGADRLGEGLLVEAVADDGTIEAVSVPSAKTFALGVQWHPEWKPNEMPAYRAILEAFGQAVRDQSNASQIGHNKKLESSRA